MPGCSGRWHAAARLQPQAGDQRDEARTRIPRIRFHDLRHTAATLLLGRGVHPKIVSEMLGHTTIGITLDLHSRVTPTMQREAARAMDLLLASDR
ncbi:MAG: tyrosine-type recombinase/integrase [Candidatus Dormibacteria bacterium]